MNKKRIVVVLLVFVFLAMLFIPSAFGEDKSLMSQIGEVSHLITGGESIAGFYENNSEIVDIFIYFLIFLGVTQFTLAKRFKGSGKAGSAISISMAVAFSIGMFFFMRGIDKNLSDLGPIAFIIFGLVAVAFAGDLLTKIGLSKGHAIAAGYLLFYFSVWQVAQNEMIKNFGWAGPPGLVNLILSILVFAAAIYVFFGIWALFSGGKLRGFWSWLGTPITGGRGGRHPGGRTPSSRHPGGRRGDYPEPPPARRERQEAGEAEDEERDAERHTEHQQRLAALIHRLEEINARTEFQESREFQEANEIMGQIIALLNDTRRTVRGRTRFRG